MRFWSSSYDRHRRRLFRPPVSQVFRKGGHLPNNQVLDDDDDESMMRLIQNDDIDHDIQSFDEMIHRLRRNEITLLRLGWTDSDYFSYHHNHDAHHHTAPCHSALATLEWALRVNRSVRSISLGWRLSPKILFYILTAITYDGIPLYQLRHIKIVVLENELSETFLPDTILTDLFHRQQKLISIDLRSVQVSKVLLQQHQQEQKSQPSEQPHKNNSLFTATTASTNEAMAKRSKLTVASAQKSPSHPGSVIMHCVLQQYQQLSRLKSLSLIDCGVTGDIAIELAQFIHIRGGIAALSLRNNRRLSVTSKAGQNGIRIICQAPILQTLDLSLCDIDPTDIVNVAHGIAARTYPIGEILLTGNFRMDAVGLNALMEPLCCQKMLVLNLSYCNITANRLVKLFHTLAEMKSHNTLLRRVVLCGAQFANDAATMALQHLLLSDCPIRSLDLRDQPEPKPLSSQQISRIVHAMHFNYDIEEVLFDHRRPELINDPMWNALRFYQQLNQVGRRIVRPSLHPRQPMIESSQAMLHQHLNRSMRHLVTGNSATAMDWYCVLDKAREVDSLDVLYWIVRHSGVNIFYNR